MSTRNLTANGTIALAPTYELKAAHRDDAGNVYVFVTSLKTWRLVNESAHMFRPDATAPAADSDAYVPPTTARRAETNYGTYVVLSAQYQRNGGGGLGFFTGLVRALDGEMVGRVLQVTTLFSRDSEATEYDQIPVFVTDPTNPTDPDDKFRGDNFVTVAWAVVDTVSDQWDARLAELEARNNNR